MKPTAAVFANGLVAVAAFFATSIPFAAQAALQANCGSLTPTSACQQDDFDPKAACYTMLAGQYIDAGEVCVKVDQAGENLTVTYNTENGWELVEAQLWAGASLATMPVSKTGNPKIGNFPFNSGAITGADSHTFNVPLSVFGSGELCDVTGTFAAHAALRKANGSGGYQTQTGWVQGAQIAAKGSWAMYSDILFTCPADTAVLPPAELVCSNETAYALGERTFIGMGITNSRWGWEMIVNDGQTLTNKIYAGAAQNDTSKGTYVGNLTVSREGGEVTVTYTMLEGTTLDQTHLYVGTTDVATTSPGQYGNQHDLDAASEDSYTVIVNGADPTKPLYVVAHAAATVCK